MNGGGGGADSVQTSPWKTCTARGTPSLASACGTVAPFSAGETQAHLTEAEKLVETSSGVWQM